MFVGSTFLISLAFIYFYGLIVGLSLNLAIFIGIIYYIRSNRTRGVRSLGFGGGHHNEVTKLMYSCLSCGAEGGGPKCRKCGSNMKNRYSNHIQFRNQLDTLVLDVRETSILLCRYTDSKLLAAQTCAS